MTIGRTDDPESPSRVSAFFRAARLFGTGSRNPSGPAVMVPRQQGRTHERNRPRESASALEPKGPFSNRVSFVNSRLLSFCLPDRGHGSLRGRKGPPQHLVRSTGAAMSTTGSHGNQAAQRPPSQSSCTLAPWATHPRRRVTRVDLSGFLADSWLLGPAKGLARAPDTVQDHRQLSGQRHTRFAGAGSLRDRLRPILQVEARLTRVRMTTAASYISVRASVSPHREILPLRSISPD